MNINLLKAGILAGTASLAAATPAMANSPAIDQFEVRLEIQAVCSVTAGAASDIDLGGRGSTATAIQGSSEITVNCSRNTPYFIGMAPSNESNGGNGLLTSTSTTDQVPYQLRSTAGLSGSIWGNTATSSSVGNGVSGLGSGGNQTIPVYVTVDSANFTPASYKDVVTVAVNF